MNQNQRLSPFPYDEIFKQGFKQLKVIELIGENEDVLDSFYDIQSKYDKMDF